MNESIRLQDFKLYEIDSFCVRVEPVPHAKALYSNKFKLAQHVVYSET